MNKSRYTVAEFIFQCKQRINNSINDSSIAEAVSELGYTTERLEEGQLLLTEAVDLTERFDKEYGGVSAAYDQRNRERDQAETLFDKHFAVAKIVFKGSKDALVALGLAKAVARTNSGWINTARTFYNNLLANAQWVEQMAAFNMGAEALTKGQTAVATLEKASEAILVGKGNAQDATKTRDAKLDELAEWVNDYESIAKLALADRPQLLEKLGIVVK